VIAFERRCPTEQLLILLNYNDQPTEWIQSIPWTFRKIFDSSANVWEGPGAITPVAIHPGQPVQLNPHAAIIFELFNES
jgi:hypothetical protein